MKGQSRLLVDIHVHPFVDEKEILNEMNVAHVDSAVLLAVDVDPADIEKPEIRSRIRKHHLESSLGFQGSRFTSAEDEMKRFFQVLIMQYPGLKSSNEEIADMVRRNPNKFIGFGSVNPNGDEVYVEKKLVEIRTLGLRGIKMLPTLQFFSPIENKNFLKICEFCEKNKMILLYHTGCDPGPWESSALSQDANPEHLKTILENYNPIIVLAHAGSYSMYKPGIWFEEAIELGKDFENVYFDSAAVSSFIFSEKVIEKIRETMGLERLLYGSDYPIVFESNMRYEVNVIKTCRYLSEDEKENILGLNAARILNLATHAHT